MEDKEIIQKLLDHYEHHYPLMPEEFDAAKDYLSENNMLHGVCWLSEKHLKIDITDRAFITNNYRWKFHSGRYWHKTPFHCESMSQVRRSILMRIDMLKSLLK